MTSTIERIIKSVPIDRTAGQVVSRGEQYRQPDFDAFLSDVRPATKPLPPNSPNVVGARFGRLQVVGLSADFHKRWVVRCSCSYYAIRTLTALRKGKGDCALMCDKCAHLEGLKAGKRAKCRGCGGITQGGLICAKCAYARLEAGS